MSCTQGGLWNYGRRRKENVGRPGIWDGCDFWQSGGERGKENGRGGGGREEKEEKEGGKEKRHRQEEERERHRQEELKRHGRNDKVLRVMFYDKNVFDLRIEEA